MQPLVNSLCDLRECDSSADIKAEDLLKMFEEKSDSSDYFTYLGSLTTEPYTENVVWIVNPKPIIVSHNQVTFFTNNQLMPGFWNVRYVIHWLM